MGSPDVELNPEENGAGKGARTLDLHVGNVAL